MFLTSDTELDLAGGAPARGIGRALVPVSRSRLGGVRQRLARIDWVPDLGTQIGTRAWWRGFASCTALCGATWLLSPAIAPLTGHVAAPATGAARDEARAQAIAPIAWGATTGRRMAANDLVTALAEAPERPEVDLAATVAEGEIVALGDDFTRLLERAGVGSDEAARAASLIGSAVDPDDIAAGTRVALTLGRRPNRMVARPLEKLSLRARFDLGLSLTRAGGGLTLVRQPIAVDHSPLRLRGLVGRSLYRSLRAAGAPAGIVDTYMKALAGRLSLRRDVAAADSFDLVVARDRAATGETRLGGLAYAGLDRGDRQVRLLRWGDGDDARWYDADGTSEERGAMAMPVAGHITSSFGMRFHPILGFTRMHKGIDIGAPVGTPVFAVVDGVVQSAGWSGGYGNFIKLAHRDALATGYGHLSRIAVRRGQRVSRGQLIGYVGSTGMSTGPHLHWEVWRGGQAINPMGISLDHVERLSGSALAAFKARLATVLAAKAG